MGMENILEVWSDGGSRGRRCWCRGGSGILVLDHDGPNRTAYLDLERKQRWNAGRQVVCNVAG